MVQLFQTAFTSNGQRFSSTSSSTDGGGTGELIVWVFEYVLLGIAIGGFIKGGYEMGLFALQMTVNDSSLEMEIERKALKLKSIFRNYVPIIEVIVSYGLAMLLRMVLLLSLQIVKYVLEIILYLVIFLIRSSIWSSPVRKAVKYLVATLFPFFKASNSEKNAISGKNNGKSDIFISSISMTWVVLYLSTMISIGIMQRSRAIGPDLNLGWTFYSIAVITFTSHIYAVFFLVCTALLPPSSILFSYKKSKKSVSTTNVLDPSFSIEEERKLRRQASKQTNKARSKVLDLLQFKSPLVSSPLHDECLTALVLLYLPLVLFSAPSALFIASILFGDVSR
jgi:hypothetical protein